MPQRDALPLKVYRNGLLVTGLQVISMAESAGMERLDVAHLLYNLFDLEGRNFHSQIVCDEIEIIRDDTGEVLHWGKVSVVPPTLNVYGESLIIVSRAEKFLIGERVNGVWVWNPMQASTGIGDDIAGGPELIAADMVFNPVIDGRVYGNRNSVWTSEQDPDTHEQIGHPLFLNPESVKTSGAIQLQTGDASEPVEAVQWKLSQAIHYLLQTLNADETYLANPTYATIAAACNDDEDLVLNTIIHRGAYLAEALDMLLEPLGYRWRIKKTALGARTFEFYNQTAGTPVWVRHQPIGSSLNMPSQNVEAAGLTFDVANLFNQVTVVGGPYAYEVSIELLRGWPESQDNLEQKQYAKDGPNFAAAKDAWRRWVLNEAGDYIGLRPEIDGVFTAAARAALEDEFGDTIWNSFVPCRRRFAPTLTLADDNSPIGTHGPGIELEYFNIKHVPADPETDTPGNGLVQPQWKPIGNWGAQVLERECGVYFDGNLPPLTKEFEVSDRASIRLRATFTLVSDKRLEASALRHTDSPQADVAPFVIDAPTKFRHQEITTLSKYYNSGRPSLEAIDNTAIADFAERVRAIRDLMDVGGAIQLEGLDASDGGTAYEVGQRVQGILGKGLSFEAKDASDEYPQIVAIERNVTSQMTTLHLQRIKRPITFGGSELRGARLGRSGRQ